MRCTLCHGRVRDIVDQGQYRYYLCADCEVSQLLPPPTAAELEEYYRIYHSTSGTYGGFEDRMAADFPAKLALVSQGVNPQGARLLDVGCGRGFFVAAAKNAGFEAEGIDISSTAATYARNELKVMVHPGQLGPTSHPQWEGLFDVATMWAAIEHVADPLDVLKGAYAALKPHGRFFIDTGLGASPWEQWLAGYSQWYDAPQHLFVFSAKGMVQLLESVGFNVVSVDTNFERSTIRRWARYARHSATCATSGLLVGAALGRENFKAMRRSAKWPIGRLLSVVCRKF